LKPIEIEDKDFIWRLTVYKQNEIIKKKLDPTDPFNQDVRKLMEKAGTWESFAEGIQR
jgi:hypothetical protein